MYLLRTGLEGDGSIHVLVAEIEKTAHAPARLFGIRERGFIREGYWADLVLVDPNTPTRNGPIFSKCGWSPFDDIVFGSRVRMTWVNGALRYRNGDLLSGSGGRALEFTPS